jgi:hypothetical protein
MIGYEIVVEGVAVDTLGQVVHVLPGGFEVARLVEDVQGFEFLWLLRGRNC